MLLKQKKTIIILALAVILAASCFYYFSIYNSFRAVTFQADYRGYSSGEELFLDSELVVIGSPIRNFEDREMQVTKFRTGTVQSFHTFTEIKVEKILKGPEELTELKVIEPVALEQTLTGQIKLSYEDYTEMKNGSSYLIFMKKNTEGQYGVINMQAGKFNLDQTDLDDISKEHPNKQEIFAELKAKYIN